MSSESEDLVNLAVLPRDRRVYPKPW